MFNRELDKFEEKVLNQIGNDLGIRNFKVSLTNDLLSSQLVFEVRIGKVSDFKKKLMKRAKSEKLEKYITFSVKPKYDIKNGFTMVRRQDVKEGMLRLSRRYSKDLILGYFRLKEATNV